ncbi:MAG: hypothetical protein JRC90_03210 [Deltaproteobacteria bacterium]|nr:hypothetical protein [Deltaproteobacteria bacterium]
MTLVRIVKNWDWPDLMRQTPCQKGVWNGIQFTVDSIEECDFLIMLNNSMETDTHVRCPKENIWAIMQEPYMKGHSDWMVEKHEFFSKVFTHYIPANDRKYISSHPAIPWHVNKTFDELMSAKVPVKSKKLSAIVGDAMDVPGHIKRRKFLQYIQNDKSLELDLYGKKINFIEDKWDGLAPYKYSLAMENTSGPDYWTEKIADCFLSWTVPIYYGCTNLENYFPNESFIRIDIGRPEESLAKIRRIINEDNWERYIPALEEARDLVLNRYQIFPYLSEIIHSHSRTISKKVSVTNPAYKRSRKAQIHHVIYKLKKKMRLL